MISVSLSPLVLYILWKCIGAFNCGCGRPNDNNESYASGNSNDERWHVAKARETDVQYSSALSRIDDEPHGGTSSHSLLTDQQGDDYV